MDLIFWSWPALTLALIVSVLILSLVRRSPFRGGGSAKNGNGTCHTTNENNTVKVLPSPARMPIIGHLYLFQGNPIIELTKLSKKYGDIYKLYLGSVETVVVNSLPLIKEVLMQKGSDFGDRPNFLRYSILFGDNKDNSLAFCDWSSVQKTRRSLARRFCHTGLFADRVETALQTTTDILMAHIRSDIGLGESCPNLKLNLQKACGNIFFDFFCSKVVTEWEEDAEFDRVVKLFDDIFWEINQSHATDVLPFLAPVFKQHLSALANMGTEIRQYVINRIIVPHAAQLDKDNPIDFVDILLTHLEEAEPKNRLTQDQVLYELEDFLGGHCAVSNLLCRAIVEIADSPGMSDKIYVKHFEQGNKEYIQAVIYETLRRTSSPIVPHVASCNSSIGGYPINKGTMIMINNYDLNSSHDLWERPDEFIPERFLLDGGNGRFKKPAHFFPFSYGKRACMGYQLVEKVTEGLILAMVKNFDITPLDNPTQLPIASVALHPNEQLRVKLTPRQ
ncbi:cytochrome P450 307a1 isoform X2 [Folsomia candida]|uniref:Cytochrome P450 307a1 n=3 Tax=Folsomia candida TaxID=158441 RepID=A0A226EYT1_FOLCA|nr:cytochrome P450 307a1 isoform X2 [Folsomia candida]XP_021960010.1 cytochrome P450 307a1 isoform X2 [Folsomia candida]OXA62274.1 Cytochrome P450 307a1 [Folsomia candida]